MAVHLAPGERRRPWTLQPPEHDVGSLTSSWSVPASDRPLDIALAKVASQVVGGGITSGVWQARLAEVAVADDQRIEDASGMGARSTVVWAGPRRRDLPPLLRRGDVAAADALAAGVYAVSATPRAVTGLCWLLGRRCV